MALAVFSLVLIPHIYHLTLTHGIVTVLRFPLEVLTSKYIIKLLLTVLL